jgi:hypothetical protein
MTYDFTAAGQQVHHEEDVDEHVEAQRGENVARVRVVPHADLERNHHGRVEQQDRADEEHHCRAGRRSSAQIHDIIVIELKGSQMVGEIGFG